MIRSIIGCLFIFFAGTISAHQPDVSSTMLSQQANKQWALQIRASLDAYKYEAATLPKKSYASPEEFQALVIQHVLSNVSIIFDKNIKATLKNPYVKLGHETNVIFEVVGVPDDFKTVEITNRSFKDIGRNKSALIVLKKGFSQEQLVLNNSNNHTVHLALKGKKFIIDDSKGNQVLARPGLFFGMIFLGAIGYFLIKNVKK